MASTHKASADSSPPQNGLGMKSKSSLALFDTTEIVSNQVAKAPRKVNFGTTCSVILIPCLQEYRDAGINLWFEYEEFQRAKVDASAEIQEYMHMNPSLTFEECVLRLHQPQSLFDAQLSPQSVDDDEEVSPLSVTGSINSSNSSSSYTNATGLNRLSLKSNDAQFTKDANAATASGALRRGSANTNPELCDSSVDGSVGEETSPRLERKLSYAERPSDVSVGSTGINSPATYTGETDDDACSDYEADRDSASNGSNSHQHHLQFSTMQPSSSNSSNSSSSRQQQQQSLPLRRPQAGGPGTAARKARDSLTGEQSQVLATNSSSSTRSGSGGGKDKDSSSSSSLCEKGEGFNVHHPNAAAVTPTISAIEILLVTDSPGIAEATALFIQSKYPSYQWNTTVVRTAAAGMDELQARVDAMKEAELAVAAARAAANAPLPSPPPLPAVAVAVPPLVAPGVVNLFPQRCGSYDSNVSAALGLRARRIQDRKNRLDSAPRSLQPLSPIVPFSVKGRTRSSSSDFSGSNGDGSSVDTPPGMPAGLTSPSLKTKAADPGTDTDTDENSVVDSFAAGAAGAAQPRQDKKRRNRAKSIDIHDLNGDRGSPICGADNVPRTPPRSATSPSTVAERFSRPSRSLLTTAMLLAVNNAAEQDLKRRGSVPSVSAAKSVQSGLVLSMQQEEAGGGSVSSRVLPVPNSNKQAEPASAAAPRQFDMVLIDSALGALAHARIAGERARKLERAITGVIVPPTNANNSGENTGGLDPANSSSTDGLGGCAAAAAAESFTDTTSATELLERIQTAFGEAAFPVAISAFNDNADAAAGGGMDGGGVEPRVQKVYSGDQGDSGLTLAAALHGSGSGPLGGVGGSPYRRASHEDLARAIEDAVGLVTATSMDDLTCTSSGSIGSHHSGDRNKQQTQSLLVDDDAEEGGESISPSFSLKLRDGSELPSHKTLPGMKRGFDGTPHVEYSAEPSNDTAAAVAAVSSSSSSSSSSSVATATLSAAATSKANNERRHSDTQVMAHLQDVDREYDCYHQAWRDVTVKNSSQGTHHITHHGDDNYNSSREKGGEEEEEEEQEQDTSMNSGGAFCRDVAGGDDNSDCDDGEENTWRFT